MDPIKYKKTEDWRRNKQEVDYEIAAVILPLVLYFISLMVVQLIPTQLDNRNLLYIFKIPDGFFGGCIMFSFAIIQNARINNLLEENVIQTKIYNSKWFSYMGLLICIILSFVSIIFQPVWSFPIGIVTIYLGSLSYKKVIFYRSYLNYIRHLT